MKVALAGASGLIGTALKESLRRDGHEVKVLVRHPTSVPGEDSWDPAKGLLDPNFIADCDAVVCLSGVGVGDKRWTDERKKLIRDSRVDSVATIARSLAEYGGPRVFVSASAVGYYGQDTGDRVIDETAPAGDDFLAQVCLDWEGAAEPAKAAGVRVAHPRTGLVLAPGGGLLGRLVPLFKFGLGGRLGSGRQYMPWISIDDEVGAIRFLLEHDVEGPVNVCAPNPVTNAQFTKALGAAVHRPALFVVPGFALHIALGGFADGVLGGQREVPNVLESAGYRFTHSELSDALRHVLA